MPAYDVVIHGRLEALVGGYDLRSQTADLAGVIAGLGLRRLAILGHSLEATTALVLAGTALEVPGAVLLPVHEPRGVKH